MEELLAALHRPPSRRSPDLAAWVRAHRERPARSPLHDAIMGGLEAGSLGLAFAAGYQAALRRLVPTLDAHRLAALAATERGGAHPKAIETTFEGGHLRGEKSFVTLGAQTERLFVVARRERDQRDLVLVQLAAEAPGVTLVELPPAPFMPEIPHAQLRLDVAASDAEPLPGDGYLDYLKPFRTVEDLFVQLALLAHAAALAGVTGAAPSLRERLTAQVAALAGLAQQPPSSPVVHLALGGALPASRTILGELALHLETREHPRAAEWRRDLAVLEVAEGARRRRLERAWEAFD